jgi:hypothetical protein
MCGKSFLTERLGLATNLSGERRARSVPKKAFRLIQRVQLTQLIQFLAFTHSPSSATLLPPFLCNFDTKGESLILIQ